MFYGKDSRTPFLLLLAAIAPACKGGSSSGTAVVTVEETVTPFYAASLSGVGFSSDAPSPSQLRSAFGTAEFGSLGTYAHSISFSNGSEQTAVGEYAIQPSGKMTTATNLGTLPGAVNPEEDFLYQADIDLADGRLGLALSASPVSFPSNAIPDFTGNYILAGIQFLYPGGPGFELNESARAVLGSMLLVQDLPLGGSFFVNGSDSAGNPAAFQGSFTVSPDDLGLAFFLDGAPGEVWLGSFAPSGLIVLSDTTLENGDAGSYAAVFESQFAGSGPFAFDGSYRTATLRFYADEFTPFGTTVEGALRSFSLDGTFSDLCDGPMPCAGIALSPSPYSLASDGSLVMESPFLASPVEGAITSDLGAFVAVEMGGSSSGLPEEIALIVGVRLLP